MVAAVLVVGAATAGGLAPAGRERLLPSSPTSSPSRAGPPPHGIYAAVIGAGTLAGGALIGALSSYSIPVLSAPVSPYRRPRCCWSWHGPDT